MAAGSRTLKLSILADVDQLNKSLKAANGDVEKSAGRISDFGKKAAVAFAIAGTAVLAFAADAVKAAAQDEAAQKKLADTIEATTTATAAQVKGVEDYITKTSIAIGVTDDELRPAFARLVRSTNDVEEATKLTNLALDLAAATGKPLETVANALAKSFDGNTTALGKLGIGLDQNEIKTMSNEDIIESLEKTYGRFAEGAAETTAKKFERIRIATTEAKEAIGAALLPIVQKLADYLLITVVPNLEAFINGLTGKGSLAEATEDARGSAYRWGEQIKKVLGKIIEFKDELLIVTAVIAGVFVVSKISAAVMATIALIKTLIVAYNLLKTSAIVTGVATAFALNPLLGVGAVALAAAVLAGATALANNSDFEAPSTGAIPFKSGFAPPSGGAAIPAMPKVVIPEVSGLSAATKSAKSVAVAATNTGQGSTYFPGMGMNDANPALNFLPYASKTNADLTAKSPFGAGPNSFSGSNTVNVTVNGAIDPIGTARSIYQVLGGEATTSGTFSNIGGSRLFQP